jgi:NAD(P)-dependent dehydrogenase (short-subunit alcohol dehydrogenase family)
VIDVKDLVGKSVLVTGAASGIGRALALAMARQVAGLALVDIDEAGVHEVAREIEIGGGRAVPFVVDLTSKEEVERLYTEVMETFEEIEILLNVAGVATGGRMQNTSLEDWEWVLGVDLWAPIYLIHFFLPQMISRRSGHIVNVSSLNGLVGAALQAPYVTAKFGVVGLSESLRMELGEYNIGVTTVCPGMVDTPIMKKNVKYIDLDPSCADAYRFGTSAEKMANAMIEGIKKNKPMVIYPRYYHLMYALKKLSLSLSNWINAATYRSIARKYEVEIPSD